METGNVKWFDPRKGFGFIQSGHGGADIYVHINAVRKAGLKSLKEGQMVFFERVFHGDRVAAQDLALV